MQMTVRFILACELVNSTPEGKLNIMGEFNSLTNPHLPVVQPMMFIVGRVEASVTSGMQHAAQLIVADEDGAAVWTSPPLPFTFTKHPERGHPMRADMVFRLGGMVFPNYGPYAFTLWVDGTSQDTVVVFVQPNPPQPQQQSGE